MCACDLFGPGYFEKQRRQEFDKTSLLLLLPVLTATDDEGQYRDDVRRKPSPYHVCRS